MGILVKSEMLLKGVHQLHPPPQRLRLLQPLLLAIPQGRRLTLYHCQLDRRLRIIFRNPVTEDELGAAEHEMDHPLYILLFQETCPSAIHKMDIENEAIGKGNQYTSETERMMWKHYQNTKGT